jgi:proline dehydrogenase
MLDSLSKQFFKVLAASGTLKKFASSYGMRPNGFATRFIAGESMDEAMAAARIIEQTGLMTTLDLLGESVSSAAEAGQATEAYLGVIRAIAAAGVTRNISLKLTQMGLDIDRATCVDNFRRILDEATKLDFFVRIDMENSPYTDRTLDIFETIWNSGYHNTGTVIQSCLKRSEADVRRLNTLGARVRLVKGAYKEPADVAYQLKSEVDAAYVKLVQLLLSEGTYPAFGTHDPAMLSEATAFAAAKGIDKSRYEFQMLYGIRRDLQTKYSSEGHRFRVYVPFGKEWFPYFMRRLGERPANVGFVLKGIVGER